jgi:hypothetical protein
MNIDSIKNYPSTTGLKHKYKQGVLEKSESMGVQEEKLNRGYYSGSFTGRNVAAVKNFKDNLGTTFIDKIFRSEKFKKVAEIFENKTVVAQTLVALVVAGVARPVTNLLMAGKKDKEDSIYAASHAISSAVIGFVVSSIVMAPFDKAFRKIKENPKQYLQGLEQLLDVEEIGKRKLEKSRVYKKLSKMAQMIPDTLVLGIPKAMLTIALIPPILKHVFGLEKGKKKEKMNTTQQYTQNPIDNNPTFSKIKGGVQ